MQTEGETIDQSYEGLNARSDEGFPRSCPRCNRQYPDLKAFVANTRPIFGTSGLVERDDPASGRLVLLMRNCTCGTTLALRCNDRRDGSEKGAFHRHRFETMVAMLVESGVPADSARVALRRMLRA